MKIPLIHKLLSTVRRWDRRKVTIRELMALDDQMLADIGLHRSEIRTVADELARFAPPTRTRTTASGERVLRAQSAPSVVADDEPKMAA